MSKKICLGLVAAVWAGALAGCATPERGSAVRIQAAPGKLSIQLAEKPFTEYVYEGASRPYLYPILDPDGARMTRHWPQEEFPNEEKDHPHHRSLWWAHGAMNGVDFWSESPTAGRIRQTSYVVAHRGSARILRANNEYVAKDGRVVCTDERELTFSGKGSVRIIDFDIRLHASNGDLRFGDTKEGTMAIRLAETMRLKGKVGQGHIVNSEGVRDGATWGKRAKWVDYHGPVDGRTVGVAIFDHPSNPRHPTWWHVRDYGLFAANPFGIHDFEKQPAGTGDLTVPAGQSIRFRYRFYFHTGDEKQGGVAEAYEKYVQNPE